MRGGGAFRLFVRLSFPAAIAGPFWSKDMKDITMERLYVSKLCNMFQPTASVNLDGLPTWIGDPAAEGVEGFKRKHGGVWVGGRLVVTGEEIRFSPNALNVAVHDRLSSILIPLASVQSVSWTFGFFTGIIDVVCPDGRYRFRCYGAKGVVRQIESLRKRA